MIFALLVIFHLFRSYFCEISCYNCPINANNFDSLVTVNNVPTILANCSIVTQQNECSIRVIWTTKPDKTQIILLAGGERINEQDEQKLENTITLKNNGSHVQWTKSIFYKCFTDQCNSPSALKRILRSLKSEDSFNELSALLATNPEFQGTLCFFFANSSVPCETEMDPNTCRQCSTFETTNSKSFEVCSNCIMDDVIENFITRQVTFFINSRERHDYWTIECQLKDCNMVDTGNLIREKSTILFDFDHFINNSGQKANLSFILTTILGLMTLTLK